MKPCRQGHMPIIDDWDGTGFSEERFEELRAKLHAVGGKVLELVATELDNPMDAFFCLTFVRCFIRDQYKLKKTDAIDRLLGESARPWEP